MENKPHAIFEIDGYRWDSFLHKSLFQRVSVDLATGEASQAIWQCFDPDFRVIDKYAGVASGASSLPVIRAWLGYGDNLGEPVFKGLLARVERGDSSTTFRAYDMSYRMRLIQKAEYHKGGDLAIIEKLVKRNALKFQGPDKPLKLEPHKAMAQDEQTDWQHAAEVAHDAGLLLYTRDDTVFAAYPAKVGKPKLTLTYKKDLAILRNFDLAFKVPENKRGRPKGIEVRGRGRGGKRLSGKSDQAQRGRELLHVKRDLAMHTQQRATARAQAQKELDREHAFTISISQLLSSSPAFRPDVRDTIRLAEMGKLFSGDYLADKVTHEFASGRLSTMFELYRDVKE
jgi:phage protein D